jgi:dihydroneopterin aldolase
VLGQKFIVDATLWADLAAAGSSDRLEDTIDYSKAYR